MKPTILVVEDKESMAEMLVQALGAEGYAVETAADGAQGIKRLREMRADVVITDLKLPKKDGLAVLAEAKSRDPLLPVIVMTAFGTIETAVKAVKEGAYDFLTKPFEMDHLLLVVRRAVESRQLLTENLLLREEFAEKIGMPRIIGKGPAIGEVTRVIQRVAPAQTTVLLQGESGTGKELFARAVHHLSPRKENPFVAINCAAIPRELLETELFGHERGSFTGAVERRIGKFELAHRGTIFLDEVGDLDPSLQAKLLRVLQDQSFERVGGNAPIQVDVRVVAATNRDLKKLVDAKAFREDLYYRLSAFPVTIPPLRDRREDIPALAEFFLTRACAEMKKPVKRLSKGAVEALQSWTWPGNVRELENALDRAVILSEAEELAPEHLGLPGGGASAHGPGDLPADAGLHEVGAAAAAEAEARLIRKVLAETGGNKSKAAIRLKVSYKTLLTKIKDYGIE
ncbi:MAG: sigma-54-dependent Fis family transcriptional regulator [Nitrospirae bacterium]|nr:sigma-54-dependent Fis family transcriptional regulator [Nitrospirota bacterium]